MGPGTRHTYILAIANSFIQLEHCRRVDARSGPLASAMLLDMKKCLIPECCLEFCRLARRRGSDVASEICVQYPSPPTQ